MCRTGDTDLAKTHARLHLRDARFRTQSFSNWKPGTDVLR